MILAAGLSPAWQTIMRFEHFVPGEVNRAAEVQRFASGKVINVAVAAAHLGEPVGVLSLIGGKDQQTLDRELSAFDITRHWVLSETPVRCCTTILDTARQQTTELVENAPSVTTEELARFAALFAREARQARVVVLTGSLPKGAPVDFFATLLEGVACPVILDARGPELFAALRHRPWLVKPNRDELGVTLGRTIDTDADLRAGMTELANYGAQRVLVSAGERPAWLLDERFMQVQLPHLNRVVNPIGCGDCLAAGVAVGVSRGMAAEDCIALGMAAAADNATQLLSARLDPAAVARFQSQVEIVR